MLTDEYGSRCLGCSSYVCDGCSPLPDTDTPLVLPPSVFLSPASCFLVHAFNQFSFFDRSHREDARVVIDWQYNTRVGVVPGYHPSMTSVAAAAPTLTLPDCLAVFSAPEARPSSLTGS